MGSFSDFVRQKITVDENLCKSIPNDEITGDSDRTNIRKFFPDLFDSGPLDTTNLPQGCKLGHYLIVGGAPVVDLYADDTPGTFQEKHGVTVYNAEFLAERKLIIPNLYQRKPKKWKNSDLQMEGLVAKSYVVGARIDEMLSRKYRYKKYVKKMKRFLKKHYGDKVIYDINQSDLKRRRIGSDDFTIIAKRYSYLKIYEPQAARESKRLFKKGKFHEASKRIRIQKWTSCTDITGAIGGRFVFGPRNIDHMYQSGQLSHSDAEFVRRFLGDRCEAIEYLLQAVGGGARTHETGVINSASLCDFLAQEDVVRIKREMAVLADELFEDAVLGGVNDPKAEDYRRLQREYEERFAKATAIGKRAEEGVAVAIEAAGIMTGYAVEAALGIAGVFLSTLGVLQERPGEKLAKWAASSRRDRVRSRVIALTQVT